MKKAKSYNKGNTKKYYIQNDKSVGEERIETYLNQNRIFHLMYARFNDCINPLTGQNLIFDFYLPLQNTIIEYDGSQHDEYTPKFHGSKKSGKFEKQQAKDIIKNKYCETKGFKLIRIKYSQWDKIEDILAKELLQNKKIKAPIKIKETTKKT